MYKALSLILTLCLCACALACSLTYYKYVKACVPLAEVQTRSIEVATQITIMEFQRKSVALPKKGEA